MIETEIIYGSELSKEIKYKLHNEINDMVTKYRKPCLAVVLVGDDAASISYVKSKKKACEEVGIKQEIYHLPETTKQEELEEVLKKCSKDSEIDGILLQLPLPEQLNEEKALLCIDPDKDVDGLHPINFGKFFLNQPAFIPCTPLGVMKLLDKMDCNLDGKHAVVVGRSKLVGTPVARLLQNKNATVTICHSHTKNLREYTKQADILVVAVGKPKFIDKTYIKEGCYVVDVGINRVDGKLCGDCDTESMLGIARAITPVPKGVGPMTVTMLLKNTYKAYKKHIKENVYE